MNKTTIVRTPLLIHFGMQQGATMLLLWSFALIAWPLDSFGQGETILSCTKLPTNGVAMMTNAAPVGVLLSQRLGGPVFDELLKNKFVLLENGVLRLDRVSVGKIKTLLKCEDNDLRQMPSSSAGFPSFYVLFADVRCIVEVAEERKSVHDDATLVTVTISTNPLPASVPGSFSAKRRSGKVSNPQNNK